MVKIKLTVFRFIIICFITILVASALFSLMIAHLLDGPINRVKERGAIETTGVIYKCSYSKLENRNIAYFKYVVNDKCYTHPVSFYSDKFEVGQTISVIYEKEHPYVAAYLHNMSVVPKVSGSLLLLAAIFIFIMTFRDECKLLLEDTMFADAVW